MNERLAQPKGRSIYTQETQHSMQTTSVKKSPPNRYLKHNQETNMQFGRDPFLIPCSQTTPLQQSKASARRVIKAVLVSKRLLKVHIKEDIKT